MRMLIILLGVASWSGLSLGAETAQYMTLKKQGAAVEEPRPRSRCARKIVLGSEKGVVACLMQKRKAPTDEPDRHASGSTRDEPARTRRGATQPSSR
jgi:hypothetical protein